MYIADGVEITDSAFGDIDTFKRDGRHEVPPAAKTDKPETVTGNQETAFRSVYVNNIGFPTFVTSVNITGFPISVIEAPPKFPEGSVIVREKLAAGDSSTPLSLMVMVKRGAGFNPAGGDWEYISLNGAGTMVRERGQLASCQSCHVRQKESDFIFRDYLSKQQELKEH